MSVFANVFVDAIRVTVFWCGDVHEHTVGLLLGLWLFRRIIAQYIHVSTTA